MLRERIKHRLHPITAALKRLDGLQKATLLCSLLVLLLSFTQPAFYIDRAGAREAWSDSFILFALGWMSFLAGDLLSCLIWLANPFYLLAVVLVVRGKKAGRVCSLLATLLAWSFSRRDSIMASEAGTYAAITSLEAGYLLWVTSFALLSAGTVLHYFIRRPKALQPPGR